MPAKLWGGGIHPADSYRGARRNAARGTRRSLWLRDRRKAMGLTRSEYDRLARKAQETNP